MVHSTGMYLLVLGIPYQARSELVIAMGGVIRQTNPCIGCIDTVPSANIISVQGPVPRLQTLYQIDSYVGKKHIKVPYKFTTYTSLHWNEVVSAHELCEVF